MDSATHNGGNVWSRRACALAAVGLLATAVVLEVAGSIIGRSAGYFDYDGGATPVAIWMPGILRGVAILAAIGTACAALVAAAGARVRRQVAADAGRVLRHWSSIAFAIAAGAFFILLNVDEPLFYSLVHEDGIVEDTTTISLFAGAALFGIAARRRNAEKYVRHFCAASCVLLLLAGLEEISWGQRIFGIESPEFFIENNDQREINIHNTLQQWTDVRTTHVVGLVFVVYGIIAPWLVHLGIVTRRGLLRYVVFPPIFLSPAFAFGALFMTDLPTGNEEEIGELLLSVCLAIFAGYLAASTGSTARSTAVRQTS